MPYCPVPPVTHCHIPLLASPPVLLAHEQVEGILCSQEVVVIQDLYGTHPVWIEVPGNLEEGKKEMQYCAQAACPVNKHLHSTQHPHLGARWDPVCPLCWMKKLSKRHQLPWWRWPWP